MKIFAWIFAAFLFFPFGYLAYHSFSNLNELGASLSSLDLGEISWALKNSIFQSTLSAVLSLLMAIPLFQGLQFIRASFSAKARFWFELILVLPNLLPSLLIVFLLMDLIEPFPTGLLGVSFIHGYMNAGVVALLLDRLYRQKLRALADVSSVLGSTRWFFLRKSFALYGRDLLGCFLIVFVFSFASFTVPLLAGGGKATTIEILMFEKLKLTGQYGEALLLSLFQWLILFLLSRWNDSQVSVSSAGSESNRFFASRWGFIFLCAVILLPFLFLMFEMTAGFEILWQMDRMSEQIGALLLPSFLFSLSVSFGIVCLFMFVSYSLSASWLRRTLKSFSSPSTSMLGLVLLLVLLKSGAADSAALAWALWSIGLIYIYLPILLRWGWMSELNSLSEQVQIAETLGASRSRIFFWIILPQMASRLSWLATVAGIWSLGDFALGKILLSETATLSLLGESLLTSYRIHAGLAVMGIILGLGVLLAVLIQGVKFVYSQWLEKKLYS